MVTSGEVVSIQRDRIKGWVSGPGNPTSIKVGLYDVESLLVVTEARLGEHGRLDFDLTIPPHVYDGQPHVLTVMAEGASRPLVNGSRYFIGHASALAAPTGALARSTVAKSASPQDTQDLSRDLLTGIAQALTVQSAALERLLMRSSQGITVSEALPVQPPQQHDPKPPTLEARYGDYILDALSERHGRDIIFFAVIDWYFRIQRPQHIAKGLADRGHRVFYVSASFAPADGRSRFEIIGSPHPGVFTIRVKLPLPLPSVYDGFTAQQNEDLSAALRELVDMLQLKAPTAILQFPTWHKAVSTVPGVTIVHDCLDRIDGFSNVPPQVVDEEKTLVKEADLIVTSSQPLAEIIGATRDSRIIRNAADVAFFAKKPDTQPWQKTKPVVGYFGAISEWFEIDWVAHAAKKHPEWDFVLIGDTHGCRTEGVRPLGNVHLLNEQPYADLPGYLHQFDVAIIPFKINDLIVCTNPVKVYEYLSAGVPVVASPMPEVIALGDLVSVAADADAFEQKLVAAMQDSPAERDRRSTWALQHTWTARVDDFDRAIDAVWPKVSVVILCYNNLAFTETCLRSVQMFSDYEDLEIICVDNASTDGTGEFLKRQRGIQVISNDTNLGFAGGNNVGIRAASGDIVILLNNDTYVTPGWVRDLIRPLLRHDRIGVCGPLTNNIGNEQKTKVSYQNMQEMRQAARAFTAPRKRTYYPTENLAFFCVAIRRDVLDAVGLLDEDYGVGFFEDDDYCQRVRAAGYDMAISDGAFIHHHLSASFSLLPDNGRQRQLEKNKAIFESKWGPWRPHRYRNEEGFG